VSGDVFTGNSGSSIGNYRCGNPAAWLDSADFGRLVDGDERHFFGDAHSPHSFR
jgi:hypothetical protein